MDYLDNLWEKSGSPTERSVYPSDTIVVAVDTWSQLYQSNRLFNECSVDSINVIKTPSGWYTIELYSRNANGTPTIFVVTNFEQQDLGHFRNFVVIEDIEFFGYHQPNPEGMYTKEQIIIRLNEFLKKRQHIISGNVKEKLTTWVNNEF